METTENTTGTQCGNRENCNDCNVAQAFDRGAISRSHGEKGNNEGNRSEVEIGWETKSERKNERLLFVTR